MKIETKSPPYIHGDISISSIEIKPISFMSFATAAVRSSGGRDEKVAQRQFFRERIKMQVTATGSTGEVPLDDVLISMMPLKYALALKDALNVVSLVNDKGDCELIHQGDGIVSPIHIKLGTPIQAQGGKAITELEFMAGTLGDLEDAVVADHPLERTMALIKIAKPVMSEGNLMVLPSWAAEQISLSDGLWINTKISPSFFGALSE
jgi:hypothetical protein